MVGAAIGLPTTGEDMITAMLCLLLSFLYVFLRAFQQLNVVHNHYAWVMPVSLGMGLCDVALILYVVRANTLWLGVVNGLGAGLGAMAAMRAHGAWIRVTKSRGEG